jgi:preprotein translocase subunit SecY
VQFWLQLALALICGVLLEFATSGRAFSPSSTRGYGDAIYWGIYGFALLWLAIALAFYYTRAARKLVARPASYLSLGKAGFLSFWFVFAGMLAGLLGVLISFTGLALSISLLIVKTVSQPPGIAITDPSKIVRALNVFVLIVNFDLLMAHVIGIGIALWLGIGVTRARLKYVTVPEA